jgi:hypothetical protein
MVARRRPDGLHPDEVMCGHDASAQPGIDREGNLIPGRYWQPGWREGGAMLLAASSSSYPLLNVFWTIFVVFL